MSTFILTKWQLKNTRSAVLHDWLYLFYTHVGQEVMCSGENRAMQVRQGRKRGRERATGRLGRQEWMRGRGENFDTEGQRTGLWDSRGFRERETHTLNFWSHQQHACPTGRGKRKRRKKKNERVDCLERVRNFVTVGLCVWEPKLLDSVWMGIPAVRFRWGLFHERLDLVTDS